MSAWTGELGLLAARVRRWVDASLSGQAHEPFETLALDLSHWQQRHDPVIRSLCDEPVIRWDQIPAVPVGVFQELTVGSCPPDEAAATFHTSGTTTGRPGVHRLRSTLLYDHASVAFAKRMMPGMPSDVVALLGDPASHPHSSLSHMVSLFGRCSWHVEDGTLDVDKASAAIRALVDRGTPLLLASTAFAMAQWLEHAPPALPPGSIVFVTGGFKGRTHTLEGNALYAEIRRQLAPGRLVTEYGMTELSSQLWGTPELPYLPPPWLAVIAVDPVSGERLDPGERGQLRFYDLCNIDASVGIETMDLGAVSSSGAVTLLGRIAGAPLRGCSLAMQG